MDKRIYFVTLGLLALIVLIAYFVSPSGSFSALSYENRWSPLGVAFILIVSFTVASIVYDLVDHILTAAILRSKGTKGEVSMILGLWRFIVIFLTLIIILSLYIPSSEFGLIGTLLVSFGGLFLGWSLQQPVSGFAAWVLVTLKRPFRVGDRVQLPSYGLVGDVIEVGPMYTIMNQVGGAVGSEEAVGRHVLVPNAMLFTNLAINYTPKWEKMPPPVPIQQEGPAHILDEVVVRVTFDSDWDEAERILLNAAREVTADIIKDTGQEPYIRSELSEYYGVVMRLRYMTLATDRPRITHEICKRIFQDFKSNEKVDLAIPYIYSYKKGAQWAPPLSQEQIATLARLPSRLNQAQDPMSEGKIPCFYCSAENSVDAIFCNKCGKRLAQQFPAGKGE
jgi:small-conductance mechanosensitive channel/ribosomal protein L40E